jgi:GT2 family glycosyltransferase
MNEMKWISVNMVTANHASFLPGCLSSLQDQDASLATVTVIDNASDDGTVRYLEQNHPEVTVLRNFRSLGRARALNQAAAFALSRFDEAMWPHRYVLFTVPEAEFAPDCLRHLVEALEKEPSLAAATPLLLDAHVRASGFDEDRETERTELVEAAGISLTRSRRLRLLGRGEASSAHSGSREVFGASATACMIRASVLASLKEGGEWFDESFQGGGEEVDFAWRLRRTGGGVMCVGEAHMWVRQANHPRKKNRTAFRQRIHEERNRFWMIWKNDSVGSMLRYSPWIFASFLFSLSGFFGGIWALGRLPRVWMKRKAYGLASTVEPAALRHWFI